MTRRLPDRELNTVFCDTLQIIKTYLLMIIILWVFVYNLMHIMIIGVHLSYGVA